MLGRCKLAAFIVIMASLSYGQAGVPIRNLPATVDTNSGTKSASTLRVVLATDQPTNTNALKVDGSAVTQPVSGTVANSNFPATVDTNTGNASASSPRVVLATNQPAVTVTPTPTATTGAAVTPCNILSAASTNSTSCKGSAGNFFGFEIYNTTTTVYYLRLYNTAGAPTCSSATGFIRSIPIPPAPAAGGVGGIVSNKAYGVNFSTGIGYCITGGSTSTDNTNAATGIFGEIDYL